MNIKNIHTDFSPVEDDWWEEGNFGFVYAVLGYGLEYGRYKTVRLAVEFPHAGICEVEVDCCVIEIGE